MITRGTIIFVALASVAGAVLFNISYRVQTMNSELASLEHQIAAEKEAIRVLRAEWSYLNQPQRLERLARTHLDLEPVRGWQFAKLGDVPEALPSAPGEDGIPRPGRNPFQHHGPFRDDSPMPELHMLPDDHGIIHQASAPASTDDVGRATGGEERAAAPTPDQPRAQTQAAPQGETTASGTTSADSSSSTGPRPTAPVEAQPDRDALDALLTRMAEDWR